MKALQHYSQVDPTKCVACHTCERRCIAQAIKVVRPDSVGGNVQTPCQKACPTNVNVAKYVSLIGDRRFKDAYNQILKDNPFPSVCGRICTHPCESQCNRASVDQAVSIRSLKLFVADTLYKDGDPEAVQALADNGKSVGIIGAGPSGMTAAYYLRLLGYEVHVYEEEQEAGGVLLYGVPEYRLPKAILRQEIAHIVNTGVNMHLGCSVGKDVTIDELKTRHDALYMATGTKFSRKVNIPGEDLEGVYHGLDFLHEVNLGKEIPIGEKAVVIGGGNTAVDVSRTLLRLGCKDVTILYRRGVVDMPADGIEIKEALEEGIHIHPLAAPVAILGNGKVAGIECEKTEYVFKDDYGRNDIKVIPESNFVIECDMVIPAVSQYFDLPFVGRDAFDSNEKGSFVTDEKMMTSVDGIFAGGDMIRGSDVAVTAIADGKTAAIQIDTYLGGKGELYTGEEIDPVEELKQENMFKRDRFAVEYLPLDVRSSTFEEAVVGFTEENAVAEAQRCLRCDAQCKAVVDKEKCLDCNMCVEFCPHGACTMVLRDEPGVVGGLQIPKEHRKEIAELCKKAYLYPMFGICPCTGVTAAEAAEAIINGAHTPAEVAAATGAGSGCGGIYCNIEVQCLLEAAGYPVKDRGDGFHMYNTLTNWSVPEEIGDLYPTLHAERDKKLNFKPELFDDVDNLFA